MEPAGWLQFLCAGECYIWHFTLAHIVSWSCTIQAERWSSAHVECFLLLDDVQKLSACRGEMWFHVSKTLQDLSGNNLFSGGTCIYTIRSHLSYFSIRFGGEGDFV